VQDEVVALHRDGWQRDAVLGVGGRQGHRVCRRRLCLGVWAW
jgi:hypothetical protein